jgi:hypothetical protein
MKNHTMRLVTRKSECKKVEGAASVQNETVSTRRNYRLQTNQVQSPLMAKEEKIFRGWHALPGFSSN